MCIPKSIRVYVLPYIASESFSLGTNVPKFHEWQLKKIYSGLLYKVWLWVSKGIWYKCNIFNSEECFKVNLLNPRIPLSSTAKQFCIYNCSCYNTEAIAICVMNDSATLKSAGDKEASTKLSSAASYDIMLNCYKIQHIA